MSDRPQNPNQPEHDSGFDDPEYPTIQQLRQEQNDDIPSTSLKPWPLAFTIFGLGLLLAIAFALLFSGCAQTSITTKYFTMKTQANLKNFTATETTFHAMITLSITKSGRGCRR